jgi:hypothetical protein
MCETRWKELKMKRYIKPAMAGAITATAALLMGSPEAFASNATYSPTAKTLNLLTTDAPASYDLDITSPSGVNASGAITLAAGVTVTVLATSTDSEAPAVTALPQTLNYNTLSQTKTTTLSVDPAGVAPGTYTYTVGGSPSPKPGGWGLGGASLTVVISSPSVTAVDETEPEVTISKPVENAIYVLGEEVTIEFEATEDVSPITAVSAVVENDPVALTLTNPNTLVVGAAGSVTPALIGVYTLHAEATSAGGTGAANRDFIVNYDMSNAWLPPLSLGKVAKGGSTIPIKFTVKDYDGTFVIDDSVKVVVYEILNGDQFQWQALFGDGSSAVRIDEVSEQYIANFQTSPGSHSYRVDVLFLDNQGNYMIQASKAFSVGK